MANRIGDMPLPPYINERDNDPARVIDRERYQTVYAEASGSVAAPTAGLHFTKELLEKIRGQGVQICSVTLHVGAGTFAPVKARQASEHAMHEERFAVSEETAAIIRSAKQDQRRVIAVGTTSVRTLEYAAQQGGGKISPMSGEADIFIYPGFEFRVVRGMLTNFHLPQSTLLMLVSAFGGKENVLRAYQHAVSERYRFYSYGDCMFLE